MPVKDSNKGKGKSLTELIRLNFVVYNDGATSPKRRVYNAYADPNLFKLRKSHARYQPLAIRNNQESNRDNDGVRER